MYGTIVGSNETSQEDIKSKQKPKKAEKVLFNLLYDINDKKREQLLRIKGVNKDREKLCK